MPSTERSRDCFVEFTIFLCGRDYAVLCLWGRVIGINANIILQYLRQVILEEQEKSRTKNTPLQHTGVNTERLR